jgi:hypothetical protein
MLIKVDAWKCEAVGDSGKPCGHVWLVKDVLKPPRWCAKCRSRQWNSTAVSGLDIGKGESWSPSELKEFIEEPIPEKVWAADNLARLRKLNEAKYGKK